jgi:hypothetical protein
MLIVAFRLCLLHSSRGEVVEGAGTVVVVPRFLLMIDVWLFV